MTLFAKCAFKRLFKVIFEVYVTFYFIRFMCFSYVFYQTESLFMFT